MLLCYFFFFNDTATTEIYTLSLHDALPISNPLMKRDELAQWGSWTRIVDSRTMLTLARGENLKTPFEWRRPWNADRKSTRLNSSHANISYAVFCLKKKNNKITILIPLRSPV